MNTTHPRPRPILLLLSFIVGLAISAFAVVSPARAQDPAPPTVDETLCSAGLIPCGGPALPSTPTSGQPIVTASIVASAPECYAPARLHVDSVVGHDTVVYMVEPYGWSFDSYRLNAGSGFSQATWTSNYSDYRPVVAVASANAPNVVLYAFKLVSPPCIEPPLPPVEVRPYPTPNVKVTADCGKKNKLTIELKSDVNVEFVYVTVLQAPQKGGPNDEYWSGGVVGKGIKKQEVRVPWSVRDVPVFVSVSDQYGPISDWVLVLPKGGCKLAYNPSEVLPPFYGGK